MKSLILRWTHSQRDLEGGGGPRSKFEIVEVDVSPSFHSAQKGSNIWGNPHISVGVDSWVATAFGQTWLDHSYLAEFGQFCLTEFGQTVFGHFFLCAVGGFGGGGPKGWGPER